MSVVAQGGPLDGWARWLLKERHGGDAAHAQRLRIELDRYANRVIDGLSLQPGMTLLDIGSGDGLVAWRAIERVGSTLQVVLTDLSADLLRNAQATARQRKVAGQCRFIRGAAERLDGIAASSVDAVAMRAVLAYVHDKPAALQECYRVLKPGGRLSLAEPLMQDEALDTIALRRMVDSEQESAQLPLLTIMHKWKSAQFPDTLELLASHPLVNYSERDLLALVRQCGFEDIRMELHIEVKRCEGIPWATFIATSPHPWAPTLAEVLDDRFDAHERQFLEDLLRPSIEAGINHAVERIVYLTAGRPA